MNAWLEFLVAFRRSGGLHFVAGVWVGFAIVGILTAFGLYP